MKNVLNDQECHEILQKFYILNPKYKVKFASWQQKDYLKILKTSSHFILIDKGPNPL